MNSALPVTVPVMAVYDALFGRGQIAHLERLRAAVESAEPASTRCRPVSRPAAAGAIANRPIAQRCSGDRFPGSNRAATR